ncbi:MAG: hypothetical protein CME24_06035 [Gemmatimonadetes bacterium]|nr:hypothetical protein [Gemmatimonadota bacterium]
MNLSIEGASILFDDCPQKLWGIRLANGTRDDTTTKELIGLLDEYRSYGVNTITTFFMGCRESAYDPFSPDGRQIDDDHARRMRSLAQALEDRGTVLVAGIFYQNAPIGLTDRSAVENAIRTATRTFAGFGNVIINVVNEHNSSGWAKHGCYPFQDPDEIIHLCRIAKEEGVIRTRKVACRLPSDAGKLSRSSLAQHPTCEEHNDIFHTGCQHCPHGGRLSGFGRRPGRAVLSARDETV